MGDEWKCLGYWQLDLGWYPPPSFLLLGFIFWNSASLQGSDPGQDPARNAAAVLTIIGLSSQLKGNVNTCAGGRCVEPPQGAGTSHALIPPLSFPPFLWSGAWSIFKSCWALYCGISLPELFIRDWS